MHPSTAFVRARPRQTGWPRSAWVVIGLMCATIAALASALVWRGADSAPQEPGLPLALAAGGAASPQATSTGPKPVVSAPSVEHRAPTGRKAPTNGAVSDGVAVETVQREARATGVGAVTSPR